MTKIIQFPADAPKISSGTVIADVDFPQKDRPGSAIIYLSDMEFDTDGDDADLDNWCHLLLTCEDMEEMEDYINTEDNTLTEDGEHFVNESLSDHYGYCLNDWFYEIRFLTGRYANLINPDEDFRDLGGNDTDAFDTGPYDAD